MKILHRIFLLLELGGYRLAKLNVTQMLASFWSQINN